MMTVMGKEYPPVKLAMDAVKRIRSLRGGVLPLKASLEMEPKIGLVGVFNRGGQAGIFGGSGGWWCSGKLIRDLHEF